MKVCEKMITINKEVQSEIVMTTMEELVPETSLYRKIVKYIDFTFIYDEVKDLYCEIMEDQVLILLFYLN